MYLRGSLWPIEISLILDAIKHWQYESRRKHDMAKSECTSRVPKNRNEIYYSTSGLDKKDWKVQSCVLCFLREIAKYETEVEIVDCQTTAPAG